MPSEKEQIIEDIADHFGIIMKLLKLDLSQPQLIDTPGRVAKMLVEELCRAQFEGPPEITTFPDEELGQNEMIIVRGIRVVSICSHHWLPIVGTADIGYIPNDKFAGLSKFTRVVDYFSAKPQMQENLTREIGKFLVEALNTENVAVRIQADHYCMKLRGVKDPESDTVTSFVNGLFITNTSVKQEFYQNLK